MDGRPLKRARLEPSDDERQSAAKRGHRYGNIYINGSAPVHLGDNCLATPEPNTSVIGSLYQTKYEQLVKSLSFPRADARMRGVKKPLPSTCKWLFHHSAFRAWHSAHGMDEHKGFLWIKGKPGSGKSTLMKAALENSQKEADRAKKDQKILYYFFNARAPTSLEKSSLGFYRWLVYQILRSCPSARSTFTEMFAMREPDVAEDEWTIGDLQDFLCELVALPEPLRLCIFIDALDECELEDDVRSMVSFLEDLSEHAMDPSSSCRLQICFSSRHYPSVSIKQGLSLVVEDQFEHCQDIDRYIRKKLTGVEGEQKDALRAEVLSKSSSIFLWVVLVVEMLNKMDDSGSHLTDMRARLATVPADLSQLFKEILLKSSVGIEESIILFRWVLFSIRPLQPSELYIAIEHSCPSGIRKWLRPYDKSMLQNNRLTKYILNSSHGLVEVLSTIPPTVQCIHETVREFLISENGIASIDMALSTNLTGTTHELLKASCFRYISKQKIPDDVVQYEPDPNQAPTSVKDRLREETPFIDYAVCYGFNHAELSQNNGVPQDTFLSSKINAAGMWQGNERLWWRFYHTDKDMKGAFDPDAVIIHFLLVQRFAGLVSCLLRLAPVVNARCAKNGSALQLTCHLGYELGFQMLINNNADINRQGGDLGNALVAACYYQRKTLVQQLLNLGANVNAKGGTFEYAIIAAVVAAESTAAATWASATDTEIIALLLGNGANVNCQQEPLGSPLRIACMYGDIEVMEVLLDHGADTNTLGEVHGNGNVLEVALRHGHSEVAAMLLKFGADVGLVRGVNKAELQAALCQGNYAEAHKMVQKNAN